MVSWRCLLGRLAFLCLLVPGSSPEPFPTAPPSGVLGLYRRGGRGFMASEDRIRPQVVVRLSEFSDNTTVLACIRKQDGTLSPVLN